MSVNPISLDALRQTRYTDVEALLVGWARQALAGLNVRVSTELPEGDELAAALSVVDGYVQFEVFGGADRDPAQDVTRVDVDVYVKEDADGNPDRAAASDLAEMLRAALRFHLPGYDSGSGTVTDVSTMSRPTARPYDDNPTLRRFSAAYQVTVKSHG